MIRKLILPSTVILLLCACGPSKELQSANAQIMQLEANNKALTRSGEALKKQVSDLTSTNSSLTDQVSTCQKNAETTTQKLRATQSVIQQEREQMHAVEKKLDDALADFKNKGVDVVYRNGLVYVSMTDKLLYKSGSAALSDSGKQALVSLAQVLNDYPKLAVVVEGNTDSVQFKKGADNWTLSTERANGVVRVLRDASIDPHRLTAAGKGKYNPMADNSTAEGRAQNRRTDIILNPDMDRIWDSVEK
jgi:chemotaxis protein MotB